MKKYTTSLCSVCIAALALCSWVPVACAFEHPRYDINATVDTFAKTITATQSTTFTNNTVQPTHEVYFHLYANRRYTEQEKSFMLSYASYFKVNPFPDGFQSGEVEIQQAAVNGANASFSVVGDDQTLLRIPLETPLTPGKSIEIFLEYTVTIPHAYGRFGWHNGITALSQWYPILSVLNENGWNMHPFYPFHRPFFSEAAQYSVALTVGRDEVVIHSGEKQNERYGTPATKTLSIATSLPIRAFSLAISPRYQVHTETHDGVTIKSFYLPGDDFHAMKAAEDARDLMRFYAKKFGDYPYKEFSIAPVYLGYGGEQMSNMVFIDTRVYRLPKVLLRYFDFLISHETGHQWFYNLVGIDEYSEMWLEEGVNSYFILEYLEDKYGAGALVVDLPKPLDWLLPNFSFRRARDTRYKMLARTNRDRPIVGALSRFYEPSKIFSLAYGKGAGVVSMLRSYLGGDAFARVFKRVFDDFRFRNLSIKDFIALCEQESGQDMGWFFEQWLYAARICDYAVVDVTKDAVVLSNRGEIVMPVDVQVEYADGTSETIIWNGRGERQELALDHNARVKQIIVDPQEKLLDIDRTNNSWPRFVGVDIVPLYVGLYDVPIFLKNEYYNFIVGPEVANRGLGLKASFQKPHDFNVYAASDYEFSEQLLKSRVGFYVNYLMHRQMSGGVEIFNVDDFDTGEEDLVGGKAYLRRELWPQAYGLTDINDHVTLYLLRNRSLGGDLTLGGREDSRNTSYLKRDEAIVGSVLHLGRSGPHPDPMRGYTVDALVESSGHFLGATQYFYRGALDSAFYYPTTQKTKLALRLKYGWGYPDDKNLYELGGMDGLRGYDRKTLRGAHCGLGSLEFRFPILEDLNLSALDNIIGLESVSGVVFAEAGHSWYEDFGNSHLKKDAGLGLRFMMNVGSFLERVLVRFDAAQAIHEPKASTRFWFGVNHAF